MERKGWSESPVNVATKDSVKLEKAKDIAVHRKAIDGLKNIEIDLNKRIANLREEIRVAYANKLKEIEEIKVDLKVKRENLQVLLNEQEALNIGLKRKIVEAESREQDARNAEIFAKKKSDIADKKVEENDQDTIAEWDKIAEENDWIGKENQKLDQRSFNLDSREQGLNDRESKAKKKEDNANKTQADADIAKDKAKRDQKFVDEKLETALALRDEGRGIKGRAETLLEKAENKMADALKKEKENKGISDNLKQQKIRQDEKEEELDIWEEALKSDAIKIDKKRINLKRNVKGEE